jgi:hypothetical protein
MDNLHYPEVYNIYAIFPLKRVLLVGGSKQWKLNPSLPKEKNIAYGRGATN